MYRNQKIVQIYFNKWVNALYFPVLIQRETLILDQVQNFTGYIWNKNSVP